MIVSSCHLEESMPTLHNNTMNTDNYISQLGLHITYIYGGQRRSRFHFTSFICRTHSSMVTSLIIHAMSCVVHGTLKLDRAVQWH